MLKEKTINKYQPKIIQMFELSLKDFKGAIKLFSMKLKIKYS